MDTNFAARILALPESVRAALATVEGPGWYLSRRDGQTALHDIASYAYPEPMGQRGAGFTDAWWSASMAWSVAAVTGWSLSACYAIIAVRLQAGESDDHAAALAIIEAHIAHAESPRQTVTNLGKVGEVVNLQGPVTLSIGADGVKVVR